MTQHPAKREHTYFTRLIYTKSPVAVQEKFSLYRALPEPAMPQISAPAPQGGVGWVIQDAGPVPTWTG